MEFRNIALEFVDELCITRFHRKKRSHIRTIRGFKVHFDEKGRKSTGISYAYIALVKNGLKRNTKFAEYTYFHISLIRLKCTLLSCLNYSL